MAESKPKKRKTSASALVNTSATGGGTRTSATLELAKAINAITSDQQRVGRSMEAYTSLVASLKDNHSLTFADEEKKLRELQDTYDRQAKTQEFALAMEYKQSEATKVKAALENQKQVAVSQSEYDGLKHQLQEWKTKYDADMKLEQDNHQHEMHRALNEQKKHSDLEKSAQIAEAKANVTSLQEQNKALQEQIRSLREELKEQRNLTRNVAEANRPVAQMQNHGHGGANNGNNGGQNR